MKVYFTFFLLVPTEQSGISIGKEVLDLLSPTHGISVLNPSESVETYMTTVSTPGGENSDRCLKTESWRSLPRW